MVGIGVGGSGVIPSMPMTVANSVGVGVPSAIIPRTKSSSSRLSSDGIGVGVGSIMAQSGVHMNRPHHLALTGGANGSPMMATSTLAHTTSGPLTLLSDVNASAASTASASIGHLRNSTVDPPLSLDDDEDIMAIPTGTTPGTKYKKRASSRRSGNGNITGNGSTEITTSLNANVTNATAAAAKMNTSPIRVGNGTEIANESTLAPPVTSLTAPIPELIEPNSDMTTIPSSDLSNGGGLPDGDDSSSEEEDIGDMSDEYSSDDDYIGEDAAVASTTQLTLDPSSPLPNIGNGTGIDPSRSHAHAPDTPMQVCKPSSSTTNSPIQAPNLISPSESQLAEQLSELQLMQLHRTRLAKVNRAHLLFTVAHLVKAFEIDEKWIQILIHYSDRCADQLRIEPNRRIKQIMAQQQQHYHQSGITNAALVPPHPHVIDDHMSITPYVKIKTIAGGSHTECKFIDGVMFRKNIAHKKMRSFLRSPRVLLLNCALEYQRAENRLSSLDALFEQEQAYIKIQVSKILSWKPDIVLVEKTVSRLAQDMLRLANVTLVLNVKSTVMARLARAIQAQPIVPATDYVDKCASIGTCGRFIVEQYLANEPTSSPTPPTVSSTSSSSSMSESHTPPVLSAPTEVRSMTESSEASQLSTTNTATASSSTSTPTPTPTPAHVSAVPSSKVIVMSFEECDSKYHSTILLRGASSLMLKRIKYVLKQIILVAYHLSLETALLFDSCATYREEDIEKLQWNYYTKVAQLWGKSSEIANLLLTKSAKVKLANGQLTPFSELTPPPPASASASSSPSPSPSPSPSLAPPPPTSRAPLRVGFGMPISSSPFMDLALVPMPPAIHEVRQVLEIGNGNGGVNQGDATSTSASPSTSSLSAPLWIHDSILFGSTWFSSAFQCFPPECKGIQFYAETDKVSGALIKGQITVAPKRDQTR